MEYSAILKRSFFGIALIALMLNVVLSESDNQRKFLFCGEILMEFKLRANAYFFKKSDRKIEVRMSCKENVDVTQKNSIFSKINLVVIIFL